MQMERELPDEIWLEIMKLLDLRDLLSIGQCGRHMRTLCSMAGAWEAHRQKMKLHPPRPRAWKRKTAMSIVTFAACYQCRCRKHLMGLPLCLACIKQHQELGPLKNDIHLLDRWIHERSSKLYYDRQHLHHYNSIMDYRARMIIQHRILSNQHMMTQYISQKHSKKQQFEAALIKHKRLPTDSPTFSVA